MLLDIKNLTVCTTQDARPVVYSASVQVGEGEIVAVVGGSGSGKTTLGMSILRLLSSGLQITSGQIVLQGRDVLMNSDMDMRRMRGKNVAVIFQDPLDAFDPLFSIEYQLDEVLREHTRMNSGGRRAKIQDLLEQCGITDAPRVMKSYPHQLSGGLRQRAMIAQALAGDPLLIVADEPTSNIDVTLQAKVMEMFRGLADNRRLAFLLITHDFGIVRHLADRVYVMNDGDILESGKVADVLDHPQQDYTRALIEAAA